MNAPGVPDAGMFPACSAAPPSHRSRLVACAAALLLAAAPMIVAAEKPSPVLLQSTPGRFEIAAVQADAARLVVTEADDAWRALAVPLALPESFGSPIFVRVVPAADWADAAPFRVAVEPGTVSLWLGVGAANDRTMVRRAIIRALLTRLAVARPGAAPVAVPPRWLERGAEIWWTTRSEPAALDQLKQQSAALAPPALLDVLEWHPADPETPALAAGSYWLLAYLVAESTRAGEWPACLAQLLADADPGQAVATAFPGRFATIEERELWWQTGWHWLRRVRSLPVLDAADSRSELGALARFVFARDDRDEVVPPAVVLAHAREPAVRAELARRAADVTRIVPALHPFYRNAGLSLADALSVGATTPARRSALCATFEQDWRDAVELEAATTQALDALEHAMRAPSAPPEGLAPPRR